MSNKPGCNVGWDTPCEWLNKDCTTHVRTHVSVEGIENFISDYPFYKAVEGNLQQATGVHPREQEHKMKDIDADVDTLVEAFKKFIGRNWITATVRNSTPKFLSNMTSHEATAKSWWDILASIDDQTGSASVASYVRRHLSTLTPYHFWA